ncbi:MAG: hypothetical protein IPP77_01685 [Bacteroidetes bacterium]|nr:hypothetical protein [Bacteroidota bacterium]
MNYRMFLLSLFSAGLFLLFTLPSCKSCNKKEDPAAVAVDSTHTSFQSSNTTTLPHADTSLIPILSSILDNVFDACEKKDYERLASEIVYRGPDERRFGNDVFSYKNNHDKTVIRTTAYVFNKWNSGIETRDYTRTFEMAQPDGRSMPVVEVLFISPKRIDRKFFGFLEVNGSYKIADVTSFL